MPGLRVGSTGVSGSYGGYETQQFIAELYDVVYADRSSRDVEFFIGYCRKAAGKTLELGCGTGRVLIPAAISGCTVTGLDFSPYMLAKCRLKLAEQPREVQGRVQLIRGNMVDFTSGETYSLVTLPFRPFQHLITVEEQKSCLKNIHKRLAPSGLLILDVVNCYPPSMCSACLR